MKEHQARLGCTWEGERWFHLWSTLRAARRSEMDWTGIHSNDASTYGQYVHERRRGRWPTLLVGALAGIDPITVDVNGFREVVYGCLKIFQADPTGDSACIPLPVHFDFTRPLVIAERAVELRLQGLDVLAFWRRLALAPASSHRSRSSTSWSRTDYAICEAGVRYGANVWPVG